jgi:redox-sensitive bicupin YhaK (pirin superfamily)
VLARAQAPGPTGRQRLVSITREMLEVPPASAARSYDGDMAVPVTAQRPYVVLNTPDYVYLGESDFGGPGLKAIESIGPFSPIQASGPLITIHDSTIDAGLGIGHHPHRSNERLFYILDGQLDHDDALNRIKGHMDAGDVGQFTEGQRGMLHSEWNHGDTDSHAYILVYSTDPVPERAAFGRLRDADAPRYPEAAGVQTKELVGSGSPLKVHGDIRFFADSTLEPHARLALPFGPGEGGVLAVRRGRVSVEGKDPEVLEEGATLILPPADQARTISVRADSAARLFRVRHGPGYGFVQGTPLARR